MNIIVVQAKQISSGLFVSPEIRNFALLDITESKLLHFLYVNTLGFG